MTHHILERFCDDAVEPAMGCVGDWYIDGKLFCRTIEQPWRQNKRFESCVPVGEYTLNHFDSDKYGEVFVLSNPELNVFIHPQETGRYACLIHAANWSHQLQGCIAVGRKLSWGKHKGEPANLMITHSKATLQDLFKFIEDGDKLLIRWKHRL